MVTPAKWIRQNMFNSFQETSRDKVVRRPLTAAEIKVQRSLEKLSIPEWYLNNSSKPPKILMNDTPIELRPSSWKSGAYKKKTVSSTPTIIRKYNDSPKNNNNSSLNSSYTGLMSPNKPQTANLNNTVAVLMETSLDKKRDLSGKVTKLKKSNNISKSFPKVSPSRKIQHINLVFPPKKLESSEKIDPSLDKSFQNETKNSGVKITNTDNYKANLPKSQKKETSVLDATFIEEDSSEQQNVPNVNKRTSFSWSDFNASKMSDNSQWIYKQPSNDVDQDESQDLDDSYTPRTFNNTFGKYLHLCNTSNIKSQSFLKTITEDSEALLPPNRAPSPPPVEISTATFTRSKGKSPILRQKEVEELEEAEKSNLTCDTSLVEDIIEELRKKCKIRSSQAGVSSSTRNFVKKLVKVLEKSILDDENSSSTESSNHGNEYDDDDIESALEDDTSSGIMSGSTSMKNSDSEDLYSRSSSSPDYNWSIQANANFEESKYDNQDEDEDFWIPIPKELPMLPRTSTLLSVYSRSSGRSSGRSSADKSPCLSPIRAGSGRIFNYPEITSTRRSFSSRMYDKYCAL